MIEMDLLHKVLQFIFQPVMNYNQQKKTKIKEMITCWKWISKWTYIDFKNSNFYKLLHYFFFLRTQIQKRKTYKRRRTRIKIDNGVIRNYKKKRYRSREYIINTKLEQTIWYNKKHNLLFSTSILFVPKVWKLGLRVASYVYVRLDSVLGYL